MCLINNVEKLFCNHCNKEIDHIITNYFINYDGSDSDQYIPVSYYPEHNAISMQLNKNWTGYELTEEEQRDSIRCPYCNCYPFSDNIIEAQEVINITCFNKPNKI